MKSDFINFSFENHLALSKLNIDGPYNHIQSILPHMINNKSGQIVGISSILGKFTKANRSSYTCSKHALTAILDTLRSELEEHNVAVTSINPGYIQSHVSQNSLISETGKRMEVRDAFWHKGMKTDEFATQTVKAIYRRENECHISINWIENPFRILIRAIIPDLANYVNSYYSKSFLAANM